MVKYGDDATIIDTVLKANETTTHKTGRERQITITDNTIQSAANEAVLWCENTSQRINASKQNNDAHVTNQRSSVTIYKHQREGVGRGDICGLFPKCRLFPRTKLYIAHSI